jgi:hypothetical protein
MRNPAISLKTGAWLPYVTATIGAILTVLLCQALVRGPLNSGFEPRGAEIATLGTLGFGMTLTVLLSSIVAFRQETERIR